MSASPRRPTGPVVLWALVLAVLATIAACGVPTESTPRAITAESTTTSAAVSSGGPAATEATIYLGTPPNTGPDPEARLVAVPRNLDATPTPTAVLEALFEGPTEAEGDRNLLTLIPEGTTVVNTFLDDTDLTVALSEEFGELSGADQVAAYGQVVLSVTDLDEVVSVRFLVDGEPIDDVPTQTDPKPAVTRSDYLGMTSSDG